MLNTDVKKTPILHREYDTVRYLDVCFPFLSFISICKGEALDNRAQACQSRNTLFHSTRQVHTREYPRFHCNLKRIFSFSLSNSY